MLGSTGGRNRNGAITSVSLADHDILMLSQEGKHLVPLQTMSAFSFVGTGMAMFYNQRSLILANISAMADPEQAMLRKLNASGLLTPEILQELEQAEGSHEEKIDWLMEQVMATEAGQTFMIELREAMDNSVYPLYAAGPKGERSDALISYGLNELCLELECFYGLKDAHSVSDVAMFFIQSGLIAKLADRDAAVADGAIAELTEYWLDDLHSGYIGPSYMAQSAAQNAAGLGVSIRSITRLRQTLGAHRARYPEAAQGYYEVGNTAYVTFDSFTFESEAEELPDYYALDQSGALPNDTFGLIIQAHRQITREDSLIENVVLDLSYNGGGASPAALFVLGWFLGDAQVSVTDTFSGAQSTNVYRADVNLDHQYDKSDTVSNLNLYCLISPSSFSCGNLVPWAFKEDGRVTLLGKASGGGSCAVLPMTTAWGTAFQISGNLRISFVKNGAYYDVDRGVEPDFDIRSYDHFYDREALTEYINSLY